MSISYHILQRDATTIISDIPARVIIAGGTVVIAASSQIGRPPVTCRMAGGLVYRRDTGEIVEPIAGRDGGGDRIRDLRESMARLRDVINAGCKPGSIWTTHTYRALVRDPLAVKQDWQAYIRWARRYTGRQLEYIAALEPQRRGAWHIHAIIIPGADDQTSVYIPQADALAAWRSIASKRMPEGDTRTSGGVHLHRIEDGGDNIGAYLSAYLSDLPGDKGGRLHYYPAGMHFWRASRGVERPTVIEGLSLAQAREVAQRHTGCSCPSYSRGYQVDDGMGRFLACGCTEQYVTGRG